VKCYDEDPEHVHDETSCCECGSAFHCCGACPVFDMVNHEDQK